MKPANSQLIIAGLCLFWEVGWGGHGWDGAVSAVICKGNILKYILTVTMRI